MRFLLYKRAYCGFLVKIVRKKACSLHITLLYTLVHFEHNITTSINLVHAFLALFETVFFVEPSGKDARVDANVLESLLLGNLLDVPQQKFTNAVVMVGWVDIQRLYLIRHQAHGSHQLVSLESNIHASFS